MDLTTLMNNDRLLSPPVTPKSYPMDTVSKHYHHHHHQHDDGHEDLLPTVIYIPPVSPPASMDTVAATATAAAVVSDRRHHHHQKTFKFHLERQKALPSSLAVAPRPFPVSPPPAIPPTMAHVVPEIVIPEPLRRPHDPSRQRQQQQQARISDTKARNVYHGKRKVSTTTTTATASNTMAKPKRTKQMPLRGLSSDAADHAFSFCMNAAQVHQYGMQAILQRERQEEQRRLGNYYCSYPYHKHSRRSQQDDNDNNNNNSRSRSSSSSLMTGWCNSNETAVLQDDDDDDDDDDNMSCSTAKRASHSNASTLASQADRHMKKAKTEAAAAYDRVDVTVDDSLVYDPEWVPLYDVFDRKPNVRPTYKGKANSPLQIDHMEFYEHLHPCEANIASQLRLQPKQYLMCKRSLVLGAQDSYKKNVPFRKSDAQKLCRIDVNKVSHLWALFARLGWLEPHPQQR